MTLTAFFVFQNYRSPVLVSFKPLFKKLLVFAKIHIATSGTPIGATVAAYYFYAMICHISLELLFLLLPVLL